QCCLESRTDGQTDRQTWTAPVLLQSSGFHRASGETVLRPVKAGANITLHCDVENRRKVMWYQRCFISNHSVTEFLPDDFGWRKRVSGIKFEMNHSTGSIDLKIQNFSDSNLGFYYCATTFIDKDGKDDLLHGNIMTKLVYAGSMPSPSPSPTPLPAECGQCCPLLVIVCPVTALLSAACGYCCRKRSGLQISRRGEAYVTQRESCVEAGGGLSVYTEVKYAQL
ncbi:hypothetical protein AAFF_G00412420, partial [Aldrovandia affinis]